MADIAAQPFINYGASIAGQENTEANTAVTGEQAKQAAMQTQIQRASMPLIMRALSEATADQSGANPGSGSTAGVGPASADQSGFYNANNLEDVLRNQNYVAPYTPQEMKMLQASKTLSVADPQRGKAMFDSMEANRKARIDTQSAQNQLRMGNVYDSAAAVANRDPDGQSPGSTFSALEAIDQKDANAIRKIAVDDNGQFDPSKADQLARQYSQHLASVSHLYSGRPTKMENGQLIDEKTAQAVVGQKQTFTGLSAEQMQKEHDFWAGEMKWTTPDNVEHTDERWKVPVAYGGLGGKMTPAQAALAADQAARRQPGAGVAAPAAPGDVAHAAVAGEHPVAPPSNGAVAARRVAAKQAASPINPGAAIAAGTAPATGTDTGTLPGVNPAQLPKAVNPTAGQGPGSAGTLGSKNLENMAARTNKEIEATTEASADAARTRSLITQAKAEIAKINPRTVGPGSTIYNALLSTYTALAGEAPNALIDVTSLDKFLNQMGAQNVRQLLAGSRITNQEMMLFLTRGSPSVSMPLGGIQKLINYLDADNEYSLRYNRTKRMALKSGADPDSVGDDIEQRSPRAQFVAQRTGSTDSLGAPAAKAEDTVRVIHPDGRPGRVPASQLNDALAAGYKRAP